jgi:hypothetical protein
MSNESEHCRRQAATQRSAAAEATLANVRERCERAAVTWEAMAVRAERTERMRSERERATGDA